MDDARTAARLACLGFMEHDMGRLDTAARHFAEMYRLIFAQSSDKATNSAGEAFARALAIKDEIDVEQDRARRLVDPRWERVYGEFIEVADLLDVDRRWAYFYNECWRQHKAERDYWSPCIEAERHLTRKLAPRWQDKRSDGRNGPGPLPFLYAAAVEAHDLHTDAAWQLAEDVMGLYFGALFQESARKP